MIHTRTDLKDCLSADFKRQGMTHSFLAMLTFGEHGAAWRYIKTLRYLEYYMNNKNRGLFFKLIYLYYYLQHRRMCLKYGIYIMPNTCGKGLLLPHLGFIRVDSFCKLGENCTILPMVLFGKKEPGINGSIITGDNCYFSAGVTILGPVSIGNNVVVGAGAVVTKDIPNNKTVVGVPARPL